MRGAVDGAYEKIVQVMFESLQQMAKMSDVGGAKDGEEDKGVLNFHVILIGASFLSPFPSCCRAASRSCLIRDRQRLTSEFPISMIIVFFLEMPFLSCREYALFHRGDFSTGTGCYAGLFASCPSHVRRKSWGVCEVGDASADGQNFGKFSFFFLICTLGADRRGALAAGFVYRGRGLRSVRTFPSRRPTHAESAVLTRVGRHLILTYLASLLGLFRWD